MLDNIVRDLAALYALGHKAGPITKTVTAFIINRGTGGIPGFFDRLKSKGLEDVANSWLGGSKEPKPISTEQVNALLGTGGGLLGHIGSLFGLGTTTVSTILCYLLPKLVALLTPDGKIPADPPAEIAALVGDPRSWLRGMASEVAAAASAEAATKQPATARPAANRRPEGRPTATSASTPRPVPASVAAATVATADETEGGFPLWVPWLIVAALIPIILTMCNKESVNTADKPVSSNAQPAPATAKPAAVAPPDATMARSAAPATPPPAATTPTPPAPVAAGNAPATPAPAKPEVAPEAPMPAKSETAPAASQTPAAAKLEAPAKPVATQSDAAPKAATPAKPQPATVQASATATSASGVPQAKIYFNFNRVLLPANGGKQLAPVVDYLKKHTNARVVIAGFHDPTGNPAANEMLAKDRATRVRAALLKAGVPASAISMEKPAQTTGTGDHKEARRVEVSIKE